MSLPKALVHSTYRALAKNARVFDQSAAKRTLIAAAPTRFFVHEYETWVDVERSSDWDGARAAVDEYIRRANRGKEMYLPPHPDDTSRSPHPLLDLIRDSYRSRPNTSAAFSEAFSAVRLFTSARERTKALPSELPHGAGGGGFELTTIGDDGVWHHADPAERARIIVANPLLPGIFAHSIVCMIPPSPPPTTTDGSDGGDESKAEGAAPSATPKTSNSSQLQGATGFIVNKPLLNDQGVPVPIWAAFPGDSPALFTETLANNVVMVGGPVGAIGNRETAVFVVHRIPGVPDAVPVAPGVWSSYRSLEALDERIRADGIDVKDVMVVVGYAGWGHSQLGGEVENGSWFVADKTAAATSGSDGGDNAAAAVGDFLFSSNLVMPPSDAADAETPVIENPEKAWCQLLASWGDDHADLTRLAAIHKCRRPSDTASW